MGYEQVDRQFRESQYWSLEQALSKIKLDAEKLNKPFNVNQHGQGQRGETIHVHMEEEGKPGDLRQGAE